MKTREEVLKFGMSFKNVYEEKPFHDSEWRDFWRFAYESVTAGYHQNKEHCVWNVA